MRLPWEMNFRVLYNDFDVQFCMRMNEQQAGSATGYSIQVFAKWSANLQSDSYAILCMHRFWIFICFIACFFHIGCRQQNYPLSTLQSRSNQQNHRTLCECPVCAIGCAGKKVFIVVSASAQKQLLRKMVMFIAFISLDVIPLMLIFHQKRMKWTRKNGKNRLAAGFLNCSFPSDFGVIQFPLCHLRHNLFPLMAFQ